MGQFSVTIPTAAGSVLSDSQQAATNWREKQVLDDFISELEARFSAEGDQSIGEKTTSQWLTWAKDRAAELDPFTDGLAGLFHDVGRP